MKKVWIICAVAVSLATGFALPVMAEDQNVAGTWNGTLRVRQGNRGFAEDTFTLALKQDGQAVTGTFSLKLGGTGSRGGKDFEDRRAKGTLVGDMLSLKIGQQRSFEATVNGDSMSGTTANGNNPAAALTGTRAK
jgi:hypothetical protein